MTSTPPTPSSSSSSSSLSSSTHAYAILSTSSALLSRSNSSNSSLNHHSFSPSHKGARHRHSKSFASDTPPSLPTPPSTIRYRSFDSSAGYVSDNSSIRSDNTSDSGDISMVVRDPVLQSLRNGLTLSRPESWSHVQLASYLRSQNKEQLATFVINNRITGMVFVNMKQDSSSLKELNNDMAPEMREELLYESRSLKRAARAASKQLQGPVSFSSEESGFDDGDTPTFMSRRRVRSMVATIESAPPSPDVPNSMPFRSIFIDRPSIDVMGVQDGKKVSEVASMNGTPVLPVSKDSQGATEPDIASLLADGSRYSNVFGAQAWEQEIISATAKKLGASLSLNTSEKTKQIQLQDIFNRKFSDTAVTSSEVDLPSNDRNPLVAEAGGISEDNGISSKVLANTASSDLETIKTLRMRVQELEAKLLNAEERHRAGEFDNRNTTDEPIVEPEIPHYVFMASVGLAAIVGQVVLKRLFFSSA